MPSPFTAQMKVGRPVISTSFEQALFKLYADGKITKDEALRNSDSATNLAWLMNNAEQKGNTKFEVTGRFITSKDGSSFNEFKIDGAPPR